MLFGAWLWLGWHLFIRGWHFFLRGPLAEGPRLGRAGSGLRERLAELLVLGTTLILAVVGIAGHGGRHAENETASSPRPVGFGVLLLGILLVSASCYAVLIGFVGLLVLVAGSDPSHLLRDAAGGGAILAFGVATPGSSSCRCSTRGSPASAAGAQPRLADHAESLPGRSHPGPSSPATLPASPRRSSPTNRPSQAVTDHAAEAARPAVQSPRRSGSGESWPVGDMLASSRSDAHRCRWWSR